MEGNLNNVGVVMFEAFNTNADQDTAELNSALAIGLVVVRGTRS